MTSREVRRPPSTRIDALLVLAPLDATPPATPTVVGSRSGNEVETSYAFSGEGSATCRLMRDGVAVGTAVSCTSPWFVTLTVTYRDRAGNLSVPATGRHALKSTASRPFRTDPPPPGSVPGGGGAPARDGTGVVPTRQDSTPRLGVPTIPTDEDAPVASATRPRTFPPSTPHEEASEGGGAQAGASTRSRHPPLLDFPTDVPRDVVTGTITRPMLPSALRVVVVLFLLAQNRIDRRDPQLASAPLEAEPDLDPTVFIRRPGGPPRECQRRAGAPLAHRQPQH